MPLNRDDMLKCRLFASSVKSAPAVPVSSSKPVKYVPPTPKELALAERALWIDNNVHLERDPKTKGPHFIGGKRHPFPMNPLYVPVSPLSATTRVSIVEMHNEKVSFVDIATSFGVSVARVHAVIKLSNIAREWQSNGIALQTDLQENMDRLLGSQTRVKGSRDVPMEKAKPLTSQRLLPLFRFIREDAQALTPDEAADMLNKAPFASTNKFSKIQPPLLAKVISKDVQDKSKFTFLFTDPVTNEMTVREGDGVLRTATRSEMFWRDNRKAKYRHCE